MKKNNDNDEFLFLDPDKKDEKKNKKNKKNKDKKKNKKNKNENLMEYDNEIIVGVKKIDTEENKKRKKKNKDKKKAKSKKKLKDDNKKITDINKQKSRKRMKTFLKWIIIITVVIASIILFLMSPLFNIKFIEVENNNIITTEEIIALSGIKEGENSFKINKFITKNNIKKNPYIEDIEIKRKLPDGIVINVKERVPTYLLEVEDSKYAYINNQGYILEISSMKLNLPIIKSYKTTEIKPGHRLIIEDLEKLETVLKIMENAKANQISDLITQIDINDEADIILYLESEGKTVYIGDATDINTKILLLKKCIEGEKGKVGDIFLDGKINKTNEAVFREKV